MSEKWRPISEYPQNKPKVDLWVVDAGSGDGFRLTDYFLHSSLLAGWVSPTIGDQRSLREMYPNCHPTHFMEIPGPPKPTDQGRG